RGPGPDRRAGRTVGDTPDRTGGRGRRRGRSRAVGIDPRHFHRIHYLQGRCRPLSVPPDRRRGAGRSVERPARRRRRAQ
ncbi:hypothetical protein LTR94_037671, partial [Friedmanniomyces endolithicus]